MECVKSLLNKDVINICSGEKLGCVCDILVDTSCGRVSKIVIVHKNNFISLLSKDNLFFINWCDIVKVGEDLILVDVNLNRGKK